MNRTETLDAARQAITVDRAATHGEAENTFGLIAAYWSAHLGCEVSAGDVAIMMTLFKCARMKANPGHADNYVDAVGYAAIAGELADPVPTEWTDAMVEAMVDAPVNRAAQPVEGQFQREVDIPHWDHAVAIHAAYWPQGTANATFNAETKTKG